MPLEKFNRLLRDKYGVLFTRCPDGSHHQYHTPGGRVIPIPIHSRRVALSTLRYIIPMIKRTLREEAATMSA